MRFFSLSQRASVWFCLAALIALVSRFSGTTPAVSTAADLKPTPATIGTKLPATDQSTILASAAEPPATTDGAAPKKADGEWGDIIGQFVLDGTPPDVPMLQNGKEAMCAKEIPSDELIVGKDNGLANVFIYIAPVKKPKVHPDLVEPKEKDVVMDQKGCRFTPHAIFARTGQTVLIKSMDEFNHNTRTAPTKNDGINIIVTPKSRDGLPWKVKLAESLPTQFKCDIHPWMTAWCLILDHPYGAISDADGKFKLTSVPVGDHEFKVWHEFGSGRYLEKAYKVSVKSGSNDLGKIKVSVAKLTETK